MDKIHPSSLPGATITFCLSRSSIRSHLIMLTTGFIVGMVLYGHHHFQTLVFNDLFRPSFQWGIYGASGVAVCYLGWIGYGLILGNVTKIPIEHILIRDAYSFLPLMLTIGVWLKHFSFPATLPVIPAISGVVALKVSTLQAYRLLKWPSCSVRVIHVFLATAIVLYAFVFSLMGWLRFMAFRSFADFGIFVQQFWGFAHFKLLPMTSARGIIFFGDHVSPILCILAPFYWATGWLWGSAVILLIIQSIGFATGALPLYWLAREHLQSSSVSLLISIVYLLYPAIQFPNLGDFHESLLITPLSLFAFYYLQRSSYRAMWIFVILTLMCKEDTALIIAALGLYTWFILRNRAIGGALISVALLWFIACLWIIVPFFREGQPYGYLAFFRKGAEGAGGISMMVARIMDQIRIAISLHNIVYILQLLLPLGFLSLFAPAEFLIGVPTLVEVLLYNGPPFGLVATIYSWHTAAIVPWIFISGIYGGARVMRWRQRSCTVMSWISPKAVGFSAYLVCCGVFANVAYGALPYSPTFQFDHFRISPHDRVGHELLKRIPSAGAVSATSQIIAHLAERDVVYLYPEPFKRSGWISDKPFPRPAQYVVLDTSKAVVAEMTASQQQGFMEEIRALVRRPDYPTLVARDGYVILKRNADASSNADAPSKAEEKRISSP